MRKVKRKVEEKRRRSKPPADRPNDPLPSLYNTPEPSAIAVTVIDTTFIPSPSMLASPPPHAPHARLPTLAPEGGCDRSNLVVRDIDEVLELAVPSTTEETPGPGNEEAMEEEDVPRERGCWDRRAVCGERERQVLRQRSGRREP